MSTADTELTRTEIAHHKASTTRIQAETIATLFKASSQIGGPSHPDLIIKAVISNDLSLLAERYEPPSKDGGPLVP